MVLYAFDCSIQAHDPQLSWKYPVGLLTTMDRWFASKVSPYVLYTHCFRRRDEWAVAREELVAAHPVNAESIAAIDSAIMVLCLDDEEPQT